MSEDKIRFEAPEEADVRQPRRASRLEEDDWSNKAADRKTD